MLGESAATTSYFFAETLDYGEAKLIQRGMEAEGCVAALEGASEALADVESFLADDLEARLRAAGEELGLRPREFFGLLREAVTARSATPSLFGVMEVLGRERVEKRIAAAKEYLEGT